MVWAEGWEGLSNTRCVRACVWCSCLVSVAAPAGACLASAAPLPPSFSKSGESDRNRLYLSHNFGIADEARQILSWTHDIVLPPVDAAIITPKHQRLCDLGVCVYSSSQPCSLSNRMPTPTRYATKISPSLQQCKTLQTSTHHANLVHRPVITTGPLLQIPKALPRLLQTVARTKTRP